MLEVALIGYQTDPPGVFSGWAKSDLGQLQQVISDDAENSTRGLPYQGHGRDDSDIALVFI